MKIAIISDIHANTMALDAVLGQINQIGADKIFCLGDILMAGYDPNGTGEIIFNLKEKYGSDFEIIQGNTDKMIVHYSNELFDLAAKKAPSMAYALRDDINIIDKKYVDFLKNLPENKYIDIKNIKIQLVHGSPRKQDENIYPNLNPCDVEKMTESSDASIIFCGHTHIPCGYSLENGKTVVNVGSIGRSMTENKMPYWALMNIFEDGTYQIEHKSISYDNHKASVLVSSRNFPHSNDLAKMYI